jgi:hypothetical protein
MAQAMTGASLNFNCAAVGFRTSAAKLPRTANHVRFPTAVRLLRA